ncbi:MAG: hypothetical protein AVDCRST_MAG70-1314 [uncultured Thermomicrobiales bacterium]|uniref:Uncharacterized protein n=1 Tax=uncultured Thermomicrobiales bacterium TaxID=1645740 RepID=A0A6J4UTU4_9BACT|nr:MAG: hypothetical protein AVDCRST_MAG70-1314 [uncultured Thermomicrobiales bacterium]
MDADIETMRNARANTWASERCKSRLLQDVGGDALGPVTDGT